jgi:hypothetical protein
MKYYNGHNYDFVYASFLAKLLAGQLAVALPSMARANTTHTITIT